MQKILRLSTILVLAAALAAVPGFAQSSPADLQVGATAVGFPTKDLGVGYQLRVSDPDGAVHVRSFAPGETPSFSLFDDFGQLRADGVYTWELVAIPAQRVRGKDQPAVAQTFSGAFSIVGGAFVGGGAEEPGPAAVPSKNLGPDEKVTRFTMDVVVQGSACIGIDCPNTPSFGFDTLRLQENNLRLHFDDTSTSASFPSRDWRITINDSSNGGLSHFSIDDATGGRTPFRIEAGAPTSSLYVDDGGRIGFGTSAPVVNLHVKEGNTPTLRLEQDGSQGFAAQTWDLAGNEANLFLRDASNGSTLPFRLFPGAPSNALTIEASGDIGVGTTSPESELHIVDNGAAQLRLENTADGVAWNINNSTGGEFRVSDTGDGDIELTLEQDGDLRITGAIFTGGPTCNGAGGCDGVFQPDYEVPSIEEHAADMWRNSYLPAVGPTPPNAPSFNVPEKMGGILNELEKAHIYIEQLHERLKALEAKLEEQEQSQE